MSTASSPARFNMTRLRLDLAELTAQRNALLAALHALVSCEYGTEAARIAAARQARAAIAKATQE